MPIMECRRRNYAVKYTGNNNEEVDELLALWGRYTDCSYNDGVMIITLHHDNSYKDTNNEKIMLFEDNILVLDDGELYTMDQDRFKDHFVVVNPPERKQ